MWDRMPPETRRQPIAGGCARSRWGQSTRPGTQAADSPRSSTSRREGWALGGRSDREAFLQLGRGDRRYPRESRSSPRCRAFDGIRSGIEEAFSPLPREPAVGDLDLRARGIVRRDHDGALEDRSGDPRAGLEDDLEPPPRLDRTHARLEPGRLVPLDAGLAEAQDRKS